MELEGVDKGVGIKKLKKEVLSDDSLSLHRSLIDLPIYAWR